MGYRKPEIAGQAAELTDTRSSTISVCPVTNEEGRTMNVIRAERIRTYRGPQWLIEPIGGPDAVCDEEGLLDIEERGEIVEQGLLGWSPYTHVVRCDEGDYLVQIA